MIKSQELFNAESCLHKAYWDEPIFVLRAKDPVSADVVEQWIAYRICAGLDKEEDPKIQSARQLVQQIKEWRGNNPNKIKKVPNAEKTNS